MILIWFRRCWQESVTHQPSVWKKLDPTDAGVQQMDDELG